MKRVESAAAALLIQSGAVGSVSVDYASGAGWVVTLATQTGPVPVHTKRGEVRVWRSLDSLIAWLKKAGAGRVSVNIEKYEK